METNKGSSNRWLGFVLILISAASFGSMALFANLAYQAGTSPTSLLILRFSIAALLMLPIVIWRGAKFPPRKHLFGYMFMGAVLYTLQAQSYFTALKYASSGLVALLLYTFPVMVTLLVAVLGWEKLTKDRVLPLFISIIGTALTLGQINGSALGILLSLSAAVSYAVYIVMGSRLKGDSMMGTLIILVTAGITNSMLSLNAGFQPPQTTVGWAAVFALAAIGTVLAVSTFFIGMRYTGPGQASILSTFEPVMTIALGSLFLNESFSKQQMLGGLFVLVAVVLLAKAKPAEKLATIQ